MPVKRALGFVLRKLAFILSPRWPDASIRKGLCSMGRSTPASQRDTIYRWADFIRSLMQIDVVDGDYFDSESNEFIDVNLPEYLFPDIDPDIDHGSHAGLGRITKDPAGTITSAISYKPANVIINYKQIPLSFANATSGLALFSVDNILVKLAGALIFAANAFSTVKHEMSVFEALALISCWRAQHAELLCTEDKAYEVFNEIRSDFNVSRIDRTKFSKVVEKLNEIRAIKLEEGKIKLVEKVVISEF